MQGFLLFLSFSFIACGSVNSNIQNSQVQVSSNVVREKCTNHQTCPELCANLFKFTSYELYEKCLTQPVSLVSNLNKALPLMQVSKWEAIKIEMIQSVAEFDTSVWLKYARINDKTNARNMLLWIAENAEVIAFLDNNHEILASAFNVLAKAEGRHTRVIEGMKEDLDTDFGGDQNFLRFTALENKNQAFKAGHELLKSECDGNKSCIRYLYCHISEDRFEGKIAELGLTEDLVEDRTFTYTDDCQR